MANSLDLGYTESMNTMPDSSWSAATAALYDAVATRDLKAARRALFDGADPMATNTAVKVPNSALLRVLMGSPGEHGWSLDLPMLTLLLDHGADVRAAVLKDRSAVFVLTMSRADNVAEGLARLHAHGAQVTQVDFFGWLTDLDIPALPACFSMTYAPTVVLDALWAHADEPVRRVVLQSGPVLLAMAQAKTGTPWNAESMIRAKWLLAQGATTHVDLFPAIVHATAMPGTVQMAASLTPSPEPTSPAPMPAAGAIVVPFRRRGP
jgi:hypothetical protein